MPFLPSVAPDISEAFPALIGTSILDSYPPSAGWDVTFGPLGFTLRPTTNKPYSRATEQQRKTQIDTSESAGEQSLSSWWVRSQDSWDMGGGIRWYEPGSGDKLTAHRFGDSFGVDPWTQGEVSLLRQTGTVGPHHGDTAYVSNLNVKGNQGYVEAWGDQVKWTIIDTLVSRTSTLGGGNATQPASAGGLAWIGHDGGVTRYAPYAHGNIGVNPEAYHFIDCDALTSARVWWVKSRLIIAVGPSLYEVPAELPSFEIPTRVTLGSEETPALYTHPQKDWTWTDVSETSGAILASGFTDGDSAVFRFTIEQDDLNQPILSGAAQVGRTPPGEVITSMQVYLGATIVLCTSMGVRVGLVSADGDIQYGPLTIETALPVLDVTFRDSFAYVAVTAAQPGGLSGAARIDLSAPLGESGRFAWAWDAATTDVATATSIAIVNERVMVVVGDTLWGQSATEYVDQGWIDTGRIRFGTTEPKAFRFARMVVATNGGHAALTAIAPDGSEHRVVDFTDAYRTEDDVAIVIPGRPLNQFLSFRVYLSPSPSSGLSLTPDPRTPVLSALGIKAIPAASRVRLYQFPLQVYDFESDRQGNTYGTDNGAYLRLASLEQIEESGRPVPVVDHRTGEAFFGQIDSIEFVAVNPPSGKFANFGGSATVIVRRM